MPKAVEVVAALIWRGDRFLACQRPAHKARGLLWEFVGGKVEPGETKEEALVRECREELGVTVRVGEVFTELTHVYPDLTVRLTLFHAAIPEGEPQKLEHNDLRWITVCLLYTSGKTVWLGGNIGHPLLCDTPKMKPEDYAVLELSSFQLMTMRRSPAIAVVTNLSPNRCV